LREVKGKHKICPGDEAASQNLRGFCKQETSKGLGEVEEGRGNRGCLIESTSNAKPDPIAHEEDERTLAGGGREILKKRIFGDQLLAGRTKTGCEGVTEDKAPAIK